MNKEKDLDRYLGLARPFLVNIFKKAPDHALLIDTDIRTVADVKGIHLETSPSPREDDDMVVAVALIGAGLGFLETHASDDGETEFTPDTAKLFSAACRESVKKDFEFTEEESKKLINPIDSYREQYGKTFRQKIDGFNVIAGELLDNLIGKDYDRFTFTGDVTDEYKSLYRIAIENTLTDGELNKVSINHKITKEYLQKMEKSMEKSKLSTVIKKLFT